MWPLVQQEILYIILFEENRSTKKFNVGAKVHTKRDREIRKVQIYIVVNRKVCTMPVYNQPSSQIIKEKDLRKFLLLKCEEKGKLFQMLFKIRLHLK